MITILCVLKSGGPYDAEWVRKLRDGVGAHMAAEHRFVCLSDVDVPCERIPLEHDWPGWWSKIEMFKPGVISGPTLYMDLDTVITGPLDDIIGQPYDFAMLQNFNDETFVGSGIMWFKEKAPEGVYERFAADHIRIMEYFAPASRGSYMGDQAYVFEALERNVSKVSSPAIKFYKRHCRNGLPEGTSIVAFGGRPRPTEVGAKWLLEAWS